MTQLNPCPFCGSRNIVIHKPDYYSEDDWYVECDYCKATVHDIDEEEAARLWNRRCTVECSTCRHFDEQRKGLECDIYGIAESCWSCEQWEAKQ
jgi:Lar family restriction alleviation protein